MAVIKHSSKVAIITPWQSFTPQWINGTPGGINADAIFVYRRIGSQMEIRMSFSQNSAGSVTGGVPIRLQVPEGLTIDDNVVRLGQGGGGFNNDIDGGIIVSSGTASTTIYYVRYADSTSVDFRYQNTGDWGTQGPHFTDPSLRFTGHFRIPILAWS